MRGPFVIQLDCCQLRGECTRITLHDRVKRGQIPNFCSDRIRAAISLDGEKRGAFARKELGSTHGLGVARISRMYFTASLCNCVSKMDM